MHNNQIYGLTKGQASPTTEQEMITPVQTNGINAEPFNPVKFALGMEASFVARGFVGEGEHLKELIKKALNHRGYALIDILQPCVSFNKINTYQWYLKRVYKLEDDYDKTDYEQALAKAEEWGEEIPIGIFYQKEKETFRDRFVHLDDEPMVEKESRPETVKEFFADFR